MKFGEITGTSKEIYVFSCFLFCYIWLVINYRLKLVSEYLEHIFNIVDSHIYKNNISQDAPTFFLYVLEHFGDS